MTSCVDIRRWREPAASFERWGAYREDDAWLPFLRCRGTTIVVDATLPYAADRYVAAAVLSALARWAIEGHADVTLGDQLVDAFVSERDPL